MSYHRLAPGQAIFGSCQLGEMDYELAGARSNVFTPGGVGPTSSTSFVRGDTDENGAVELNDAIQTLSYLVDGGEPPGCLDAADADDSGRVDLSDVLYTLRSLDGEGMQPSCSLDPTADDLSCGAFPPCG